MKLYSKVSIIPDHISASCIFTIAEFETILTSVDMDRHGKKMYKLPKSEDERIRNILKRAVDKESGKLSEKDVSLTEDNPDGRKIIYISNLATFNTRN